jgi:hypothetical protein
MRTFAALSIASIALVFAACSGSSKTSDFDNDAGGGGGGDNGGGDNGGGSDASYGSDIGTIGSHSEGGTTTGGGCQPNPLNYDVPGNNCDDDGDGTVDNVTVCDQGLANGGDAPTFVKALGLCQMADATHWGIVSATYSDGFNRGANPPADAQHGIMSTFGSVIVPREGSSLGVLSSGSATATDSDTGPLFKGLKNGMQPAIDVIPGTQNYAPPGYPLSTTQCPVMPATHDAINVSVQIKVPANAQGFSVDFDFWSGEWPDYVCTEFNDSFVAMLSSQAVMGGELTNISKDMMGNSINVNASFFDHCTAGVGLGCGGNGRVTGTSTCTAGPAELAGTGFAAESPAVDYCDGAHGDNGATSTSGGETGWLTSTEMVMPSETITIQFIIWDTGDWNYDSSVLLDNWQWAPTPVTPGTMVAPPK